MPRKRAFHEADRGCPGALLGYAKRGRQRVKKGRVLRMISICHRPLFYLVENHPDFGIAII